MFTRQRLYTGRMTVVRRLIVLMVVDMKSEGIGGRVDVLVCAGWELVLCGVPNVVQRLVWKLCQ